MSKIQQIICDAPKCSEVRKESNGWWIIRRTEKDNLFITCPMHDSKELEGDQHYCSSKCMHSMLDAWMEAQSPQKFMTVVSPDTYEIGSDGVKLEYQDRDFRYDRPA